MLGGSGCSNGTTPQDQIPTRPCEINGYAHHQFAYQPQIPGTRQLSETKHSAIFSLRTSARRMDTGARTPRKGKTLKSTPIAHFSEFSLRAAFSVIVSNSVHSAKGHFAV